jgi:hypothetical protein
MVSNNVESPAGRLVTVTLPDPSADTPPVEGVSSNWAAVIAPDVEVNVNDAPAGATISAVAADITLLRSVGTGYVLRVIDETLSGR